MDKVQRAWVLDEIADRLFGLAKESDDASVTSALRGVAEDLAREVQEATRPKMPLGGRINDFPKRRVRADALAHEVLKTADKYLRSREADEGQYRKRFFRDLQALFMRDGVDVVTDEDRRLCGLEPRNADGWTPSELLALEYKRLEAMMEPLRFPCFEPSTTRHGVVLEPKDKSSAEADARFAKQGGLLWFQVGEVRYVDEIAQPTRSEADVRKDADGQWTSKPVAIPDENLKSIRRRSSLAWLEAYRGAYARATSGSGQDAVLAEYLATLDEQIKARRAEEAA